MEVSRVTIMHGDFECPPYNKVPEASFDVWEKWEEDNQSEHTLNITDELPSLEEFEPAQVTVWERLYQMEKSVMGIKRPFGYNGKVFLGTHSDELKEDLLKIHFAERKVLRKKIDKKTTVVMETIAPFIKSQMKFKLKDSFVSAKLNTPLNHPFEDIFGTSESEELSSLTYETQVSISIGEVCSDLSATSTDNKVLPLQGIPETIVPEEETFVKIEQTFETDDYLTQVLQRFGSNKVKIACYEKSKNKWICHVEIDEFGIFIGKDLTELGSKNQACRKLLAKVDTKDKISRNADNEEELLPIEAPPITSNDQPETENLFENKTTESNNELLDANMEIETDHDNNENINQIMPLEEKCPEYTIYKLETYKLYKTNHKEFFLSLVNRIDQLGKMMWNHNEDFKTNRAACFILENYDEQIMRYDASKVTSLTVKGVDDFIRMFRSQLNRNSQCRIDRSRHSRTVIFEYLFCSLIYLWVIAVDHFQVFSFFFLVSQSVLFRF